MLLLGALIVEPDCPANVKAEIAAAVFLATVTVTV